ncbi:S1 family peptidase [Streptomyces sp. NPDC058295]|uniref:S1 family peptidase n=1 Tax=Streptomyces sp. NPDC058295 TaxID=3346431 RepID=UPI0036E27190
MRRLPLLTAVSAALALLVSLLLGAVPATAGPQAVAVRGGDVLYGGNGTVCLVGFNARGGSTYYALLAGRCATGETTWYADAARTVQVGVTAVVSFPGDDYGLVRYTTTAVSYPGEVSLGGGSVRDITGAAAPRIGQSVCHVGRAAGVRCGTVNALNVTVNYGGGTVSGLFRSTVCPEPGDQGGPAFSGTTALGLVVGGSGGCAAGGTTYYQPVVRILSAYGLSLY